MLLKKTLHCDAHPVSDLQMKWLLLFCVIASSALSGAESESAFWVWHRDTKLTTSEIKQLRVGQCDTLYWHVGNAAIRDGKWAGQGQWLAPDDGPSTNEIRCVPVLRGMLAGVKALPADHGGLLRLMQQAMERWHSDEVQLDFDCPDRLLPDYVRQLAACRAEIRPARLSITALAGWAALPVFETLQRSVDELAPMFYDLEPDKPPDVVLGRLLPLLDQQGIKRHLDLWARCKTPWRAGLPCFARISFFDALGSSRGHVREWLWDEPSFHASLKALPVVGAGIALFDVTKDTTLHDAPLLKGQRVAVKRVDVKEAAHCVELARAAGARSVCWFRLPTASASSGWSLAQTMSLSTAPPALSVFVGKETLMLENTGTTDLPPSLMGKNDTQRGWQIELESAHEKPVFREITAGEFAHVGAHIEPDGAAQHEVPVPEATRLTLWLGDLKAGAARRGGVFQLAPGFNPQSLRWRLRGPSIITPWQPVKLNRP